MPGIKLALIAAVQAKAFSPYLPFETPTQSLFHARSRAHPALARPAPCGAQGCSRTAAGASYCHSGSAALVESDTSTAPDAQQFQPGIAAALQFTRHPPAPFTLHPLPSTLFSLKTTRLFNQRGTLSPRDILWYFPSLALFPAGITPRAVSAPYGRTSPSQRLTRAAAAQTKDRRIKAAVNE